MEFDSSTFALEIINFLALVWLLQRFFYKPVMRVIDQRQARIEQTLADAQAVRIEADALKQHYDNRLSDWQQEQALARQHLLQEMEQERDRLMTALQAALDAERDKQRAVDQRRQAEQRRRLVEEGKAEGERFAARLLSRLASAELEDGIRRMLQEELPLLPEAQLQALRTAEQANEARISSAYALNEQQRADLIHALSQLTGRPVSGQFGQDPELIAGLRISIGPWLLHANLQDELRLFAEAQHADLRR